LIRDEQGLRQSTRWQIFKLQSQPPSCGLLHLAFLRWTFHPWKALNDSGSTKGGLRMQVVAIGVAVVAIFVT